MSNCKQEGIVVVRGVIKDGIWGKISEIGLPKDAVNSYDIFLRQESTGVWMLHGGV